MGRRRTAFPSPSIPSSGWRQRARRKCSQRSLSTPRRDTVSPPCSSPANTRNTRPTAAATLALGDTPKTAPPRPHWPPSSSASGCSSPSPCPAAPPTNRGEDTPRTTSGSATSTTCLRRSRVSTTTWVAWLDKPAKPSRRRKSLSANRNCSNSALFIVNSKQQTGVKPCKNMLLFAFSHRITIKHRSNHQKTLKKKKKKKKKKKEKKKKKKKKK